MRKAFQCLGWAVGWFWWAHFFLFGSIVSCSHVADNFLLWYKSFPFRPPKTRRWNFLLKWSFFQGSMLVSGDVIPCFYPFTLLVVFSIPRLKKKGDQPIGWHGFLLQFACWKFDRHPRCQPWWIHQWWWGEKFCNPQLLFEQPVYGSKYDGSSPVLGTCICLPEVDTQPVLMAEDRPKEQDYIL